MIRASAPPITRSYRFIRNFPPSFFLFYLLFLLSPYIILLYYYLHIPFSLPFPFHSSSNYPIYQSHHYPQPNPTQSNSPIHHIIYTLYIPLLASGSPQFQPHQNQSKPKLHILLIPGRSSPTPPRRPLPTTTSPYNSQVFM